MRSPRGYQAVDSARGAQVGCEPLRDYALTSIDARRRSAFSLHSSLVNSYDIDKSKCGVQIPFANLKPETEFEVSVPPEWVFFADAVLAPGKQAIEKIDPKANKKAEPIAGLLKPCGGMASGRLELAGL